MRLSFVVIVFLRCSFGGSARNRTETVHKARVGYSHARSHAGLRSRRPKTRRAAEGRSQGGSRSFRLVVSLVYESGAFPS